MEHLVLATWLLTDRSADADDDAGDDDGGHCNDGDYGSKADDNSGPS